MPYLYLFWLIVSVKSTAPSEFIHLSPLLSSSGPRLAPLLSGDRPLLDQYLLDKQ